MLTFLRRRLVVAVLVLLTVSVIGFGLLRVSGDLAATLAGEAASVAEIENVRSELGLDRPMLVQYVDWLMDAARGDLGTSYFSKQPVTSLFLDRVAVTATLAVGALAVAILVSLPLGIVAAVRPNSWIDRAAAAAALSGQAVPNFWLALMLVVLFGVNLRWLPISGSETPAHFVLPILTLAVSAIPALTRLTRSGMLEVLEQDYIRTAWSKGLPGRTVLGKHALRNAILPIVSLAAVQLGALLGGSVIIESVFAIDGIGLLTYRSIQRGDFPVVQSMLLFVSLSYILLTLAADILNAWLDPRMRQR